MTILTRYFIRRIGAAIGLLWGGLTLLVATLQFVAEAGGADFSTAAFLTVLQTPRLAMETLPFACAIAAAAALQRMEESRELQTIRAAGVSLGRAAFLAGGGGAIFAVALAATGEFILEPSESLARAVKNAPTARGAVWLHHEGIFFYAAEIAPGGEMREVAVYAPAADSLRVLTAARANEKDGKWNLANGDDSMLTADGVAAETFTERAWSPPPPKAALLASVRRPREMSARTLAAVADEYGGGRFAAAFWARAAAIVALPLLAACAVWSVGMRRRVTMTVLLSTGLAGAYYFASIIFSQLALLLQLPILAAAALLVPVGVLTAAVRRRFI